MKKHSVIWLIVAALGATTGPVQADIYTDDLSRCLVESTTREDKFSLVKWMFSAASQHPAVGSIANVSEQQLDETNQRTAELFVDLLTESCREQTIKAVKYEGQVAIQSGFKVLGQVAAGELFASPEVAAGMAGLQKHIDAEKLQSVFGNAAQ